MRFFGIFFIVLFAFAAAAQQPDIHLNKVAGVYNLGCAPDPTDTDVVEAFFVRTDVDPVVELGSTTVVSTRADDVAIGVVFRMDFVVPQTDNDDAEIRCYVRDAEFASDYSNNAGLIDFTRPSKPRVIACTQPAPWSWSLEWSRIQSNG
jgi:hypothetical protein